mgnify:CR=1 FL=1
MLPVPTAEILEEPTRTLDAWSAYLVPLDGLEQPWTCHLTGFRREGCKGQVSSPVIALDTQRRRARTRTGSVYELAGRPGHNADAFATWSRWKHGLHVGQEKDVTEELDLLLSPSVDD